MRRSDTAVGQGQETLKLFLAVVVASAAAPAVAAQDGLFVSARADYSTHDRLFSETNVIHVKVVPGARLDLTAVTESKVEIEPAGEGDRYEGVLAIREDGSFVASAAVAELDGRASIWHLRVSIEDVFGTEYRSRTALVIRDLAGSPDTFRVDGFVEAASAASITVSGYEFALIAVTEVHGDAGASGLIGRRVLVVAERGADGSATALQIFAQRDGSVRFIGEITAVGTSAITVDETTFSVSRQTTVKTWFGGTTSVDDLELGTYVLVAAQRTSDAWVAVAVVTRRGDVSGADDDAPHEMEGRVESVTDASITVGGMSFAVTADTEIEGAAGPAYIEVGAFVEIEFGAGERGEFIALLIEVDDEGDGDNGDGGREGEIEVEGAITALSDQSITVEGIEFIVTGSAEIDGDGDVEIGLANLYTGMFAEAEGRLASDGSVRASKIKIEHDGDRDQRFLRGEITSIEGAAVTVGKTTFVVTDSTPIRGRAGESLALGDVEAGMFARAHLEGSAGGELVAVRLNVEHRFGPNAITLAGRIDEGSAHAITVHDVTFEIDKETEIEDVRGETIAASDLQAGQVVRIGGVRTGAGYVAREVRIRTRVHHEGAYGGVVTDASGASISVSGTAFGVGSQTIVEGVASLGEIAVGDRVRLRYRILGDGSRFAIRIGVHTDVDVSTQLSGIIEDVASGVVEVAGVRVYMTLATRVYNERGRPIGSSALEAGQMVDVTGTSTAEGVVAARVNVETAVAVSGPAVVESEGRLVVAGGEYELDEQTLIVGRSNAELTADVLDAGAYVEMIAVGRGSGVEDAMYAERVLVMQTMEGTASETDEPGVATAFALEQNYPNPFNPTTTIRFDVGSPGDRDISLTVFDVLGRHVRTLVDASLSPGAYSYAWDGRDGAGRPAASGIYLYRLRVGERTATRSMALLK